ncbi:hypothetical protein N7474_003520 [Penicillium riverlandense]|uniref:uncharacterized protein n=1 Tax=Penicillium riverlandense TaxID=1903569 RepID=UPI00254995E6|nr:uncharacterized protein N7474_003520 [Penicillium riverlandense]KAJ5826382.1 hypothetical protein N7474_003520 [Penicillium riverlandense]
MSPGRLKAPFLLLPVVFKVWVNIVSSTPCQRSESTFQKSNTGPYEYQIPFSHSSEYDSGGQFQHPSLSSFGQYRRYDHDTLWKPDSRQKSPDTSRQHLDNIDPHLSTTNLASSFPSGGHFEWGPTNGYGYESLEPRPTRTGRSSNSNRTKPTGSERSNSSSPRSTAVDLQGLSLGEHVSSKLVPPHGASCRSHRNDPVLGNVQRHHDTLVVFAMLWHENAGHHGTILSQRGSPLGTNPFTRGKYQEPIYSSIRRMVVVKEQKGCCWCVPVTTYSGQGVAKAGVDRSKHAVIYMHGHGNRPITSPNEPKMVKEPIEVQPSSPDQKLDPMSRLNFGKVYTVEHNVKVLPVGKICESSLEKFLAYARTEFNR